MRQDRLQIQILTKGANFHLALKNLSDEILTDIKIGTVRIRNYDDECPAMQIRFELLPNLPAKATSEVQHQVYVDRNGQWAMAGNKDWITNDMLSCLTEELSRDANYKLHASWVVNGKTKNQTLQAGAGTGLAARVVR
jgi:hypothetical protein